MRVYTVHYRPAATSPDRDVALVPEGFSWLAFLFTALWALWHRLWFVAAALLAVELGLGIALELLGADTATGLAVQLGFGLFVGCEGNDWRRTGLAARGLREAGVVAAANPDAAYRRFLDLHPDLAGGAAV